MPKKVVLTIDDDFYEEFKVLYGRPGKPMTQIILDKMYEILTKENCVQMYNKIDECLQDVKNGNKTELGECKTGREAFQKLGIDI